MRRLIFKLSTLLVLIVVSCLWWVFDTYTAPAAGMQCGGASWYGYTGRHTANGEPFNGSGMTAAHKSLPFGTRVRVTVVDARPKLRPIKGRSIIVRINDRGPYVGGRVIDLSRDAAAALGSKPFGVAKVCLEIL